MKRRSEEWICSATVDGTRKPWARGGVAEGQRPHPIFLGRLDPPTRSAPRPRAALSPQEPSGRIADGVHAARLSSRHGDEGYYQTHPDERPRGERGNVDG
eukprot:7416919-Pyramimonas_sp.AAC.1